MEGIIDFHTHSFFSDGALSPAELVRRAEYEGYKAIAITDHVDSSNIETVLGAVIKFVKETQPYLKIKVIPGVEITHVPAAQIRYITDKARYAGAALVVLHGETICEPVPAGTNRAAIEAGVDILAHPGLITAEEVKLAADKGVFLEITGRRSHGLANGRVAGLALKYNALMVIDSDFHAPGDFLSISWREKVAAGAGLEAADLSRINQNMENLLDKILKTRTIV